MRAISKEEEEEEEEGSVLTRYKSRVVVDVVTQQKILSGNSK
jgi:hypothetical protein